LGVSEAARDAVTSGLTETFIAVQVELGDGALVVTVCGDGDTHTGARMRFPCALAVDREHDGAVERLEEALVERDRLSERLDAAVGTSTELTAYARLQAAGDRVAARQAWVHWVDNEAYRGLNAGPFELRTSGQVTRAAEPLPRLQVQELKMPDAVSGTRPRRLA
jgi:hypothetical protein